jgi:alpha(1,3/1,4) fucosyltransferase
MSGAPLKAALIVRPMRNDDVYKPGAGPQGGNFYVPYTMLRDRFALYGVELHTADLVPERERLFELHINAQHRLSGRPAYAYLYEDPLIRPVNGRRQHLLQYRKLFTSNEDLVDGARFVKLDYPNDLRMQSTAPWVDRPLGCVLIAANKALARPNPRNLHHRRVAIARAFEAHAPELFTLYGRGWGQPPTRPGIAGRLLKRVNEWRSRVRAAAPAFPSWRGQVHAKGEVLARARFAIAFENVQGSPGYITEKIFDCFVHGCVPVYLGTPGAADCIPAGCYVDARAFASDLALIDYLRGVDEPRFAAYQAAIAAYLASPEAQRFGNEQFTRALVDTIAADQGLARIEPAV